MTDVQEAYENLGRKLVNSLPTYRQKIMADFEKEHPELVKHRKKRRESAETTVDMFPDLPSSEGA